MSLTQYSHSPENQRLQRFLFVYFKKLSKLFCRNIIWFERKTNYALETTYLSKIEGKPKNRKKNTGENFRVSKIKRVYNINQQARFLCQHYDSFGPFEAGIHHNKTTPVNDKIIK